MTHTSPANDAAADDASTKAQADNALDSDIDSKMDYGGEDESNQHATDTDAIGSGKDTYEHISKES